MAAQQSCLLSLALAPFFLILVGAQNPYPGLFCPTGWVVTAGYFPGYGCGPDPCYGNPCGPGNTCTTVYGSLGQTIGGQQLSYLEASCQCNAPYLTGNTPPRLVYPRCYQPGQDVCNPNPCQNGGTCSPQQLNAVGSLDPISGGFTAGCSCPPNFVGPFCQIQVTSPGLYPIPETMVNGITGPIAASAPNPTQSATGICPTDTPNTCLYQDNAHYLCCDSAGCGPYGPDGNTPLCRGQTSVPSPNTFPPANPLGDQGLCGLFPATNAPVRCWFNNDPQGRYFCCDSAGCNGFSPDGLTPECANPNIGPQNPGAFIVESNPNLPDSGTQGVCGTGEADIFVNRCYFNNDPQGRYVCCDIQGCDGFNAPDYLIPHCKNNGYVPPGYGVGANASPPSSSPPPSSPPTGDQGVCGSGDASSFPTRCWFNNDPQGRYVCCDNAGCDGFLSDNLFPHCATNGYVPPNFGV